MSELAKSINASRQFETVMLEKSERITKLARFLTAFLVS